jgi:hypothetical protein
MIGGQLGGQVRFDWRDQGLICEIALLLAWTWRHQHSRKTRRHFDVR